MNADLNGKVVLVTGGAGGIGNVISKLFAKQNAKVIVHYHNSKNNAMEIAKNIGLDCIEFILDFNDAEINPLLKDGGAEEIKRISKETGVIVKTICADYFMEKKLEYLDPINLPLS